MGDLLIALPSARTLWFQSQVNPAFPNLPSAWKAALHCAPHAQLGCSHWQVGGSQLSNSITEATPRTLLAPTVLCWFLWKQTLKQRSECEGLFWKCSQKGSPERE